MAFTQSGGQCYNFSNFNFQKTKSITYCLSRETSSFCRKSTKIVLTRLTPVFKTTIMPAIGLPTYVQRCVEIISQKVPMYLCTCRYVTPVLHWYSA
jgi:hypothetical protein